MTTNDDEFDSLLREDWPEVEVTDELRARTMDRIHAAAQEDVPVQVSAERGGALGATVPAPKHVPKPGRVLRLPKRGLLGMVAVLLAVALGFGFYSALHAETAYATVSAQVSVTLRVNRFDTVVAVTSGDGLSQEQAEALGLVGMSYSDAISSLATSGLLGGGDVNVTVDAGASEQEETLVDSTTTKLEDAGCSGTCNGNRYGRMGGDGSTAGACETEESMAETGEVHGMGSGNGSGMGSGMGNGAGMGKMGN